jgi:putative transposase
MFYTRKRLRLKDFDYGECGFYFITISTAGQRCLFGEIKSKQMILNDAGQFIDKTWRSLPQFYSGIEMDESILMPNHLHGVLIIQNPLHSVPDLIGRFKSFTTNKYRESMTTKSWTPIDEKLWLRSFHDRIITTERGLTNIRQYIRTNPANWKSDPENPYGRGSAPSL